jgi:hypothetical protein
VIKGLGLPPGPPGVRGLLCLSRNTALGQIERKYELARAYLDSPPGQLIVTTAQAA